MIYSKEFIEEVQFEALVALEECTKLPSDLHNKVEHYCSMMDYRRIQVLSNIIASTSFTDLFLEHTKNIGVDTVDSIRLYITAAQDLATNVGIDNLFYNEQYVEVIMASILKHEYNPKTRGDDAFDVDKNPTEYKSINMTSKSGGSFQFHWISRDKLASYERVKDVYFSLREGANIKGIWSLPMSVIFPYLVTEYNKAEMKRGIMVSNGIEKEKNIDAHKSFSLSKIIKLGAKKVYESEEQELSKKSRA
ncbi:MAG: hypothetical protein DRO11_04910 [Methanobacteriota archaeon]|nr:MAG: hypothetical protein DRO11_04910 [Euryarchaeota archaeon]